MLTECPDCEKHFRGPVCSCGYRTPAEREERRPWREPDWMQGPPPCTPEENARALQLVKAVLGREITEAQAHACLHEMFQGREKEL